ncbi:hypothetical protein [Companilactobacillus metriopterae]|uniref:hypothetical protein n=1 Tax=Companilactobacillus metriopterae TaxID=1909267 RepID=UPI00100A45A6|nr:hypothetical protein [Companilactobacillus metriopterae]
MIKKNIKKFLKLDNISSLIVFSILISFLIVLSFEWIPGHVFATGDYHFHLDRMYAIVDAWKHGIMSPRVDNFFAGGYGYAASLFYPNIFLYPAAFVYLITSSATVSYLFLLFFVNLLTFWITYFAGKRLKLPEKNNIIFTVLYLLSAYRLQDLLSRHDIGELLGIAFFPLILAELIRYKDGDTKNWFIISFAIAGVGYSHVLSLIMIVGFAFIYAIIHLRSFLKKDTLIQLLKAAMFTLVLMIAYIVPVLEQMKSQKFQVSTNPLIIISDRAIPLQNILFNSFTNQIFHASTVNLGFVVIVGLLVYLVFNIRNHKDLDLTILATVMLIVSSSLFPWKLLKNTPVSVLQFPWRMFSLISLIVVYLIAKDEMNLFSRKRFLPIFMTVVSLLSIGLAQGTIIVSNYREHPYSEFEKLDSYKIGAGTEYLPEAVKYKHLIKKERVRKISYNKSEIKINDLKINNETTEFYFNANKKNTVVTIPKFYYKGYQAIVGEKGSASVPYLNKKNGMVNVKLSGKGYLTVKYHMTTLQVLSSIISLAGLVLFILSRIIISKKDTE